MRHSETPTALKLADELMDGMNDEHWNQLNADAAAELRRLHEETEQQKAVMRQALVADAERYRWLVSRAVKETAYDRYGKGARWSIGLFSEDSSLNLDAAIDHASSKT